MCFKRGDISNLMEKLVGWKSIHIGNEGKYNCNGFEFKFGESLGWQMGDIEIIWIKKDRDIDLH